jgi:heme exporter protein C
MWNFLYQLASPKSFYRIAGYLTPWLGFFALCLFTIGISWGLFFAPTDNVQGEAYRILYIHVPTAFLSLSLYTWMGFLAILLLIWRIKMAGLLIRFVAQLGASMAFLALVTGSLWGKPMWGTFWVWDARLTSELILFLLYAAILAIYPSINNRDTADKMVAILTLVGCIDLPIIHYSVNWWNTLHQEASLSIFEKPKMPGSMLIPLLLTLLGLSFYCFWVILKKARMEVLYRERRQGWVKGLMIKKSHVSF